MHTYFLKAFRWNRPFLLVAVLFLTTYLLAQDTTGGLILHYNFDLLKPTFTNLVDMSGSGFHATINGNFSVDEGQSGKSTDKSIHLLDRDRPNELVSGYLHLPDNITRDLTDFTVAVWVKLDQSSTWSRIFDFGSGTATNMFLTPNAGGGGTTRFAIKKNNQVGEQIVDGKMGLPVDEWTHVVVTGDYTNNSLKMYINGLLSGSATGVTTTPASLGDTLPQNYIGKSQYTSDPALLGCIDDFRIYNRVLSQYDIYVLYGFTEEEIENMPKNGDGKLFTYLNSFTLNNREVAQSINDQLYYYSLPLSQIDQDVDLVVSFEKADNNYLIKIDGQPILNNMTYTFKGTSAPERRHKVEFFDGTTKVATEYIVFTGLPIVQVYTNGHSLSKEFTPGKIRVHDTTNDQPYQLFNTEMRYRGGITMNYQKKSFAIKLYDDDFVKKNFVYYGLRDDNYWILDAMPIDKSRMRNRVATDLWNDFSADPYYKNEKPDLINGTRGQYVEVFLDDQYWGLYCMTERIDRKQLQLKKFDESKQRIHGLLYKAKDWSYEVMMGYVPRSGPDLYYEIADYDNNIDNWQYYDLDYPDLDDGHLIDWEPLYDLVFFVSKSEDDDFIANIDKYVDLPVWVDYYLMMEYILAVDNHGKNCYLSIRDVTKNKMFTITPWDMDATLGRRWDASAVAAEQDYPTYTKRHEHGEHYLFRRLMDTNAFGFNDLLKQRYDELRFSHFDPENMLDRFEQYKEIFERSGAATREINRWSGTNGIVVNFEDELMYLDLWLYSRFDFLNEQYGEPIILPPDPNQVADNTINNIVCYPNPVRDILNIRSIKPGENIQIFSMQGAMVFSQISSDSTVSIDISALPAGAYYLRVAGASKLIMKQ